MSVSRSGSNSSTTQACAACKYQRRKCAPDCILAPYFPHDRQRQFQNAHKLFGVSNITKIIRTLNPPEKDIAMRTIVFQSDARANDPVGGCFRIIQELQRQIEYSQAELDLVFHQLAICRAQAAAAAAQMQEPPPAVDATADHHPSAVLGCEMLNPDPLNSYNSSYYYVQEPQETEQFAAVNDHHNNVQHYNNLQENYDISWGIQESTTAMSSLNICKQSFDDHNHDDHDVKPADMGIIPVNYNNDQSRHDQINKFDQSSNSNEAAAELVERRFVPSTQLVMSS